VTLAPIRDDAAYLKEHKKLYVRLHKQDEVATELDKAGVKYIVEEHGGVSLFTLVES